jgi:dethiobiotin synthetase
VLRGLLVTGTDTGVGKTVVSAALMHRYRRDGPLRYWKPIQTGVEQDDDTREVTVLGACSADEVFTRGIRLPRPLSPHLAARLDGTTISISALVQEIEPERDRSAWIVEGAGGVLVPLNDSQMMIDFMVMLDLPVIVTARSTLGTINHTLLTIEALRRRELHVAGIVMVGDRNDENRTAIERYGDVTVIGEMPRFARVTAAGLSAWAASNLDCAGRLLELLR